jgi:hypothetical protein
VVSEADLALLMHVLILLLVALLSLLTLWVNRKLTSLNGDVKSAHEEIRKLKSSKQDRQ